MMWKVPTNRATKSLPQIKLRWWGGAGLDGGKARERGVHGEKKLCGLALFGSVRPSCMRWGYKKNRETRGRWQPLNVWISWEMLSAWRPTWVGFMCVEEWKTKLLLLSPSYWDRGPLPWTVFKACAQVILSWLCANESSPLFQTFH